MPVLPFIQAKYYRNQQHISCERTNTSMSQVTNNKNNQLVVVVHQNFATSDLRAWTFGTVWYIPCHHYCSINDLSLSTTLPTETNPSLVEMLFMYCSSNTTTSIYFYNTTSQPIVIVYVIFTSSEQCCILLLLLLVLSTEDKKQNSFNTC